jgi:lipopolysaccharide export system protein LptA
LILYPDNIITRALSLCFLLMAFTRMEVKAQGDTAKKVPIEILPGKTLFQFVQTDSGNVNKLIGNVNLKHGETLMYCDSAYIYPEKNNVQAFGNVNIVQPGGTNVQSDYLRYIGNTKMAYLKGNVSLTDGKNNLWAEELEYNVGTKVGVYTQGGTLQSDATTLSSNEGVYNVRSKDARFTGEVFVSDPQYNVTSVDLGYNTETKIVRFFGPSVVTNEKSVLKTSSGTWDGKNEIAHFVTRSSIETQEQYIEADNMDYNRKTGWGIAVGKVIAIDTTQHTTMYCGYARYNEITRKMLATIKPVMKQQQNKKDSLFIRADTFYSAPVPKEDTIAKVKAPEGKKGKSKKVAETVKADQDTVAADSSQKRYFLGYHHVMIYSDSMQAVCDSISYSQADSTMRLMYSPVAWSRNSQLTGDTILLYMDSSRLKKLFIPNNALIVSQSGPEKAQMFDQIQGKTLTAYFQNNAIKEMVVWPTAEAIYYSKDDDGAYLGMNQATSERMRVRFENENIDRIILEQEPKQTMTPMQQVNIVGSRLSRFQWLIERRPKSLQELFDYEPPKPVAAEAGKVKEPAGKLKKETGKAKKKRKK